MEDELKKKQVEEEEEGKPFYPNHFLKEVIVAFLLFGVLLSLAILFSFGLEEKANPFQTPEGIKPEWYFLAGYQLLKYVPKILGIVGIGIALIILLLVPFIERKPERELSKRRTAWSIGVIILIFAFIFGFLGYISESTRTIFGKRIYFDLKGVPHSAEPAKKDATAPKPAEPEKK